MLCGCYGVQYLVCPLPSTFTSAWCHNISTLYLLYVEMRVLLTAQGSGLKKYCTLRGSFDTDSCHVSQSLSAEIFNNSCFLFSILTIRRGFHDLFTRPKSLLEKHYAYIWKGTYRKASVCFYNQSVNLISRRKCLP